MNDSAACLEQQRFAHRPVHRVHVGERGKIPARHTASCSDPVSTLPIMATLKGGGGSELAAGTFLRGAQARELDSPQELGLQGSLGQPP